jgi:hypothetical protein
MVEEPAVVKQREIISDEEELAYRKQRITKLEQEIGELLVTYSNAIDLGVRYHTAIALGAAWTEIAAQLNYLSAIPEG